MYENNIYIYMYIFIQSSHVTVRAGRTRGALLLLQVQEVRRHRTPSQHQIHAAAPQRRKEEHHLRRVK